MQHARHLVFTVRKLFNQRTSLKVIAYILTLNEMIIVYNPNTWHAVSGYAYTDRPFTLKLSGYE